MQLDWLRTLIAVVEAEGFTRAAVQLRLSQPAVSQQMAALEREAGLPLFERVGRRRVPTEAGLLLTERARVAVASVEDAKRTLEELRGVERGLLRVGASTTPGIYLVPRWLGEFVSRYPDVDVQLDIADTGEIEERLRQRRVDVAVVGEYNSGPELVVAPLRSDVLIPICAPHEQHSAELNRFVEHRFIARERGSSTREVLEKHLRDHGLLLRPTMEFPATEAVKQAVAAGLGVSVVSRASAALELKSGVLRSPEVDNLPVRRRIDVVLLQRRRPMPATIAFLEILMGPTRGASLVRAASRAGG